MNKLLLTVLFAVIICSCKKETYHSGNIPAPVTSGFSTYPMNIGFRWNYISEITFYDLNGNITADQFNYTTWHVTGDTVINGVVAVKIHEHDSDDTGYISNTATYYETRPDGLYEIAVDQDINNFPSIGLRTKFITSLALHFKDNLKSNQFILFDSSYKCLQYPAVVGTGWDRLTDGVHADHYLYDLDSLLSVPAGTFQCIRLAQTSWSDSTVSYEYLSGKGMIQQHFEMPLTDFNGVQIGYGISNTNLVYCNF